MSQARIGHLAPGPRRAVLAAEFFEQHASSRIPSAIVAYHFA